MANTFLDTSALGKHYHPEVGSAKVDDLLRDPSSRHFVSRLSVVEIQSVFARKVRTGAITPDDFRLLRRRFLTDLTKRKFDLVRWLRLVHPEQCDWHESVYFFGRGRCGR